MKKVIFIIIVLFISLIAFRSFAQEKFALPFEYAYDSVIDPYLIINEWSASPYTQEACAPENDRCYLVCYAINPDPAGKYDYMPQFVVVILDQNNIHGYGQLFIYAYGWENDKGKTVVYEWDEDLKHYKYLNGDLIEI